MPYTIHIAREAEEELKAIRAYDRRRIVDEINGQLTHQPTVETRNRKPVPGASPGFEHVPPLWELRVGEHRVFYDVDAEANTVSVRAVRHKAAGQTTEEIIS
jgi:mRNA-degrading endonuclease RelE of RelBE toxin-antitoxin system